MNQFLSPWVLLAMLAPPILLAWRWVPLLGDAPLPAAEAKEEDARPMLAVRRAARSGGPWILAICGRLPTCRNHGRLAICPNLGTDLLGRGRLLLVRHDSRGHRMALGTDRRPQGGPRDDRRKALALVAFQPQTRYDTEFLGGGLDEHGSSYNYAAAYQYLGQYYEMSCLNEEDKLDEKALSACDVLVIKIPRVRFTPKKSRRWYSSSRPAADCSSSATTRTWKARPYT